MGAPQTRSVTSRQFVVTALGCALIAVGVVGLLEAELGVDPYTVFIDGIAAMFDLPIGVALLTAGAAMTVAAWLLGRPPTPGLTMTIGLVAVVVSIVGDLVPAPTSPIGRMLVMLGAVVLVSIGVGIYRSVKWAEGPLDALPQALGDRLGRPTLMFAVVQAALLVIGWAMGGQIGVGTVVSVVVLGPIALRTEQLVTR